MLFNRRKFADAEQTIVVAFDICSSSDVIEKLTTRGDTERYRKLLTKVKHALAHLQIKKRYVFDPYKFTGDGWILLFPKAETKRGTILRFMRDLCRLFEKAYLREVAPFIDTPPAFTGINFGIDQGPIFHTTMFQYREYFGRPINVACRLQGAIKDVAQSPAYKAMVSKAAFKEQFSKIQGYPVSDEAPTLRNISSGARFDCKKIDLAAALNRSRRKSGATG